MLQRAADNAHSWLWASHIRTKQSKWLEENLQDMEEKVTEMLKIIECNGDSFAQRVDTYYNKRPELIDQVEESYRSYRALAERYDHLSRDMQSANRTIAAVFPEQVQLHMDDEYEGNNCTTSTSSDDTNKACNLAKAGTPTIPTMPKTEFQSQFMLSMGTEEQLNSTGGLAAKSGLTPEEAMEEIEKIQKDILALRNEWEFMQGICERCNAKCCGIDNHITDMKARVRRLQKEFGIVDAIDDDEAQTLMAATALKSCSETLDKLQQKQELTAEEAKIENQRVKDLVKNFTNLRNEFQSNQTDVNVPRDEEETESEELDRPDIELLRQKLKRELEEDAGSSSFTVLQLAEKIDDLVGKVNRLETNVSSQNALVMILRSEADTFQDRVKTLEDEKEILTENSEIMSNKIKELADELQRVKILSESVKERTDSLQIDITEASFNIDHLSEKLENVKPDEESKEAAARAEIHKDKREGGSNVRSSDEEKGSVLSQNLDVKPENHQVQIKYDKKYLTETSVNPENLLEELGTDEAVGQSPSSNLLAGGREQEYTLVLRNYNEVTERLVDVEKKNRDGFFELALQIRELKNAIAMRDEEIQLLRKSNSKREDENPPRSPESIMHEPSIPDSNHSTLGSPQQQMYDYEHDSPVESTGIMDHLSREDISISTQKENTNVSKVDAQVASAIEEKLRSDIDGLLEENMEFWLRFSSSFHQIQKYQTSVQDIKAELSKLKDSRREEGNGKGQRIISEAQPIYKNLMEMQTELALWLETNSVLKDELQGRHASLREIQEEISRVSKGEEAELSQYKAARFQGEIQNMKQESSKVSEELRTNLEKVKVLKDEVGTLLSGMDVELELSAAKQRERAHKTSIPLRSFLFGVKLKTHKRSSSSSSFFSCTSPCPQP